MNRTPARAALSLAAALSFALAAIPAKAQNPQATPLMTSPATPPATASATLSARQQAIVPIAAFAAAGDIPKLGTALNQGLDAGLTVSNAREVLVQLYAYAGFPRSLNALNELMRVLAARQQRGIQDAPGRAPSRAIPRGDALLAAGTANQTRLVGAPVRGPVFEFAPAIDEYLKVHLFGAIFERDNLDWQMRELATVSMLSALPGAEAQLQSHMRVSMNVGLTAGQLRQLGQVLAERVDTETARRARDALARHLSATIEATLRDVYTAMLAADTGALGPLLAPGFTLTHITGVVQPQAEWLADIDARRMAYHAAREVSITAQPALAERDASADSATAVARHVVDASIYGGRGQWNLQLAVDLAWRDQRWVVTRMVATTYR